MATIQPDPWKALGLDRSADKSDIRTAYKKLVLKCHPDKVQDPTLKAQKANEFQKVQEAWELLNDDDKLEKYDEQVKLAELRKQAAMMAKNMPNSSASRSAPRHMSYEIRTAEPPRHKTASTPSSGAKVYAHYASVHSRSHEEMPSRMYPYDDGEKHARRTTSYDKVYREDDRREKDEKRRSKREEDDFRIRERKDREIRDKEREIREREKELEREREARKTDRKRTERDRDSQRRRDVEDKHRRHKSPYIEQYESDDHPSYSKSEKRSSSKLPYEGRDREREAPREKSTASASRRLTTPEPEIIVAPDAPPAPVPVHAKLENDIEKAADYILRSRRPKDIPVSVPTPPPADIEAAEPPRPIPRVAGRRSSHSHEASRSKEKLSSSHKSATAYIIDASPKTRMPPSLQKSHTSPPLIPESGSPPRISRSSTTPREFVAPPPQAPPGLNRTQTWAPGSGSRHEIYDHDDSDDDRQRRHRHRSSRRTRSPEAVTRTYKVDSSLKTTPYPPYGESPTSRKYMPETYESPSGSTYPPYIKVKESRSYGPADVKYAETPYTYTARNDSYSSTVY